MNETIDSSGWVELNYNGRNGSPLTYKGYMRREYRVHVLPTGQVKQTGAVIQTGGTVRVHPDDVPKLVQLLDRGKPLFTKAQQAPLREPQIGQGLIRATETAVLLAEQEGVDLTAVTGTGPDHWITEDDVRAFIAAREGADGGEGNDDSPPPPPIQSGAVDATDAAKTLAEEEGVDLTAVTGTGTNGRITKDDVQKYLDALTGS